MRSFLIVLSLFAYTAPGFAALMPAARFEEARFAFAKGEAQVTLDRLESDGINVGEILDRLRVSDPRGGKLFDDLVRRDKINARETIRLRSVTVTPAGWDIVVPGVSGTVKLSLGSAAKPEVRVNGVIIPVTAAASEQYRLVRKALPSKVTEGLILYDLFVPPAEANPVVVLPALGAIALVGVTHVLSRYFSPPPEQALSDLFREGAATCEKERAVKQAIYEGSETAALVGKLLQADVVNFPAKAGECAAFVIKMTKGQSSGASAVATEACRHADLFLGCAEKLKRSAKTINAAAPGPKDPGKPASSTPVVGEPTKDRDAK